MGPHDPSINVKINTKPKYSINIFFNRNFVVHKSVRWYRLPDTDYRPYRYPAPGSEPIDHKENRMDYKIAYRDSIHSIRYVRDTKLWNKGYNFIRDPLGETTEEKLIRYKCLDKKEKYDTKEIEEAKKKYEEKIGEKVEVAGFFFIFLIIIFFFIIY